MPKSNKPVRRYVIRIIFKDEHEICSANCNNEVMSIEKYMHSNGQYFCNSECLRNFTGKFTFETCEAARSRIAEEARKDKELQTPAQIIHHFLGI